MSSWGEDPARLRVRRASVSVAAAAILSLAQAWLPCPALAQPELLATAQADLQQRRNAVIRGYNLDAERQRLDNYVRIVGGAFRDPGITRQDPIGRLPFVADNRRDFLQRTSAFVADRLGLRFGNLTVRFSHLPKDIAGRVRLTGERATVEIADRHRDDDEEILAIVAHEFAHILLEIPGSSVPEARWSDEDLADAAIVMAGMGPLLLRASYREGLSTSAGKIEWTVRRTGSLNPVAIAYLTLVQAEMAGLTAEARRSLIGDWLEPAWTVRMKHGPANPGSAIPSPQSRLE